MYYVSYKTAIIRKQLPDTYIDKDKNFVRYIFDDRLDKITNMGVMCKKFYKNYK